MTTISRLNKEGFTTKDELDKLFRWIGDDSDMLDHTIPLTISEDLSEIVKIHQHLLELRYEGFTARKHTQPQAILLAIENIQNTLSLFQKKIGEELI